MIQAVSDNSFMSMDQRIFEISKVVESDIDIDSVVEVAASEKTIHLEDEKANAAMNSIQQSMGENASDVLLGHGGLDYNRVMALLSEI